MVTKALSFRFRVMTSFFITESGMLPNRNVKEQNFQSLLTAVNRNRSSLILTCEKHMTFQLEPLQVHRGSDCRLEFGE